MDKILNSREAAREVFEKSIKTHWAMRGQVPIDATISFLCELRDACQTEMNRLYEVRKSIKTREEEDENEAKKELISAVDAREALRRPDERFVTEVLRSVDTRIRAAMKTSMSIEVEVDAVMIPDLETVLVLSGYAVSRRPLAGPGSGAEIVHISWA